MKCEKCGTTIEPNDQFCRGCGALIKRGEFIQSDATTDEEGLEPVDDSELNHDFGPTAPTSDMLSRFKLLSFFSQASKVAISIVIVIITIIVIWIILSL